MLFNPLDYTTVFLSYDEPNCEENYRHLLSLNPQALRVHGVKGSDTAHKEVAKLSKTDSVIIVDGDNFVKPFFFTTTIELPNSVDLNTSVLSFSAYNTINGLSYGNGGIKVWPKQLLETMQTHENSKEKTVDFDFKSYVELNTIASDIHFASDKQAFRSGFREGVKLCMEQGKASTTIDYRNLDRLWMWTHVGSDTDFGLAAIKGARLGMAQTLAGYDTSRIIDFDFFDQSFTDPDMSNILSIEDSKRIRDNYINCKRSDVIPFKTTQFIEWCDGYRQAAMTDDQEKINVLCTTGRDKQYGTYKINGARLGKDFYGPIQHLYDYDWLKKEFEASLVK